MIVPSRNPACVEFRNGTVLLHHLLENSKNYSPKKTNTGNPLITSGA